MQKIEKCIALLVVEAVTVPKLPKQFSKVLCNSKILYL